MKKLLSACLSLLIAVGTSVVPAYAVNSDESAKKENAYNYLVQYMDEHKRNYMDSDYILGEPVEEIFGDYVIFPAAYNMCNPILVYSTRVSGFILESNNCYYPSTFGHLAVNSKTGDVYSLEYALKEKIVDPYEFCERCQTYLNSGDFSFRMKMIGDCDKDGVITIKDATEIQKSVAYETDINDPELQNDSISDVNYDRKTDVLDATQVQKIIAEIE